MTTEARCRRASEPGLPRRRGPAAWVASAASAWLGWTVPLLLAEWWWERDRARRPAARPRPATTGDRDPVTVA
ncbi:hypothetical protein QLQ12_04990 [Actinoplanes sp. NEAU-A12]|uniref:Uncharacterized protein n=1 Tax=Actinoplanes sandaracinus TaxID=3045177 RepID=A0ABT6WE07_9ACTN|nr:hypothetical protein [Actinoplanes sandaracinus]MDI6097955.1 hypothetical protein [Actinoplanes sandaracinus]